MLDYSQNPIEQAWQMACRWKTPPQWERREWHEEMKALSQWAGLDAEAVYNPVQHGDKDNYLLSRVLSALQTQHRREWRYGTRCYSVHRSFPSTGNDYDPSYTEFEDPLSLSAIETTEWRITLQQCLHSLNDDERRLLMALYFEECTEAELARSWGISQSAISQRKQRALKHLHVLLDGGGGGGVENGKLAAYAL